MWTSPKSWQRREEPGIHKDEEQLNNKNLGGDPATVENIEVGRECKPRGPIGFFVETLHLQAATIDENFTIRQWNQQDIELERGPAQQLVPLLARMVLRNRTRRAEDSRFESQGLIEIDIYATMAKHKDGIKEEEDKVILRLMQTGSNWTKSLSQKVGKAEDDKCDLCGEKGTKDHIWHCSRLKDKKEGRLTRN